MNGLMVARLQMYASSQHSLTQTFQHSAHALTLASRAFFNPSMLALLYFPAEHKYAVYTPLFASTLIPVVVTTIRELKAWRAARRAAVVAQT
jgi:phosphatidylinositol glycan class S